MKESYIEGVAIHDGPESCVYAGNCMSEALTGVHVGWVLSHEIKHFWVPTLLTDAEGDTGCSVNASCILTQRGRRPHACVETPCARTGRSSYCLQRMALQAASGKLEAIIR